MIDLLVDGNNLAVRVWKGSPELNTSKGQQIHIIFGVLRMLRASIEQFKADRVHVIWDGSPVHRRNIFPEYKKKRKEAREVYTPEEEESYNQFKIQVETLKSILPSFGINQLYENSTEADDFIALLASKLDSVVILSEDKDFVQLVSDKVTLYRPVSKLLYTKETFKERTGFDTAKQYLNFRVLNGDSSDEVPPVQGFGGEGKRARDLIDEHNTVQNILNKPKLNQGKIMDKLFGSKSIIVRNMMLMDLRLAVNFIDKPYKECLVQGKFDEDKVKSIILKYEFFSVLKSLKNFTAWFKNLSTNPVL